MDSNKDEALRCLRIAEEAIASDNKRRALKFIKIAQRLNHNLSVDELLAACEKLGSSDSRSNVCTTDEKRVDDDRTKPGTASFYEGLNGKRNYTEAHVGLIRQIKRNEDYYAILGVERNCSVEEIRKAYRKLSLKVHPDKNKAPGSEEAFKKVCKAFKCLSDDDSRRQYDHVDEFEHNQQHHVNVRQRRRRPEYDYFDDDLDPDEIFRSFFGQPDMFGTTRIYKTRGMGSQRMEEFQGAGFNLIPRKTEKHGVEFYVKSSAFDENFPHGSSARADIEDNVIKDYRNLLWQYCHIEVQKRRWNKNLPTPRCNKLENLGQA